MDIPINYLAILACGVSAMALGALWYGPLFGKPWMRLTGQQKPERLDASVKREIVFNYALTFASALVTAYVLSFALAFADAYAGYASVGVNVMGAFWDWIGFAVPLALASTLWNVQRSWTLFWITAGYYLVSFSLMAVILTLWK